MTAGTPAAVAAASPAAERGFGGKLWFWLPWPLLVAFDLWSKAAVFGFLSANARTHHVADQPEKLWPPVEVFGGGVRLDLVSWGNTGTIWGMGQDATIPLMVLRCAAVVGLLLFVRNTPRTARLQQFVLGLVLAGALGNLYDNFTRADRSVRDFLYFTGSWPMAWTFPAFNVADSCITVGAISLFLLLWRGDRKPKAAPVS